MEKKVQISIPPLCCFVISLFIYAFCQQVNCADVVIQIPGDRVREQDGYYRLDYWPPQGHPPPNSTFTPQQVSRGIELTRALPGAKYDFHLYYTNGTINEWPTWTASITTVPPPPSNLSIYVKSGKVAQVSWLPPIEGGYSAFKLKVIPLSEPQNSIRNLVITENQLPFKLRELTPGASYELQLYTVYENKESDSSLSANFTTRPNAPGRFIVWYRNETTMLVLWQPPYPAGIYTHYRVSIDPPDALESILLVEKKEKDGEPPGPAEAAFYGLVPGRAYNITVETKSRDKISLPTTAQYRTIPLPPRNVTFDLRTPNSFVVKWEAPDGHGEYDSYRLNLGIQKQTPLIVRASEPRQAVFTRLEPGRTYTVLVKTMADNVASWPISGNVTTRPLRVKNLELIEDDETGEVNVFWEGNEQSIQDKYKVVYVELETFNGDSRTTVTEKTYTSSELYPGRNYSVSVLAVSKGVESELETRFFITKPSSPIIEDLQPVPHGLNISWKSDVTSRQNKYEVFLIRNDTGQEIFRETEEPHLLIDTLYPGAGYEIKIFANSHDLHSEPHVYFKAVYPKPVQNLTVVDAINSSVTLLWVPPNDSLYSHFIVRYRTEDISSYNELPPINSSGATIMNLEPGEKYIIEVRSVSYRVESLTAVRVEHIVSPTPVSGVIPLLDSRNITFEWNRPEGRIDAYTIVWWNEISPDKKASKEISGSDITEGVNRKVSIVIGGLTPGQLYKFEIFTISHDVKSDTFALSTRTTPIITSEIHIVRSQQMTRSFTVRYTPTPPSVATFDKYRFMISDDAIPVKERDANDTVKKVVFDNLVPGRLYNITAWTVSGGVTSQPLVRQERLYPEPVKDILATFISETEIGLEWTKPVGDYDSFEVQYLNAEGELMTNKTLLEKIIINNLKPHRNYTFTVYTKSGDHDFGYARKSIPVSATFTTMEGKPGKVSNRISEVRFGPESRIGTITNLIPGETYAFQIQAHTRVGVGQTRQIEVRMPIEAPPIPGRQVFPTEMSKDSNTITIRFRKNYFSEENGPIIGYAIIVAEDDTKDADGLELPTWKDVQGYSVWPPYQVMKAYIPFNDTNVVEDFIIGGDENCIYRRGYCNGPLKQGTKYRVKIRAFTTPTKFADTHLSHYIVTDTESNNLGVAIAVPLVFVVLLIVVFIFLRQRRVGPFLKKATDVSHRDDVHSLSDSIIETSRPVQLRNFADHYRYMSADSDFRFSEEYEALKNVGRGLPCTAADLPVNRPKNRFTNILPYDHSRFKLQPADDEEGSDYINSNYVPGFNSPREFIVSQGPLASTRDDFWRMIWEGNCRALIMLTRCIEKGREKCDHYWPYDTNPVYYGDIKVSILNESHYANWSISEFRVSKGEAVRIIRHFHFTTWPDFGVPDPPQTLVRFARAFREKVSPDQKPIVVHCSAGVGRSGTFIALDRILQSIRVCDYVDIFGIVYEMRKERVLMVQNEQQYICIHQCLLAVLEGRETEDGSTEIHENEGFEDDEGIAESGM